MVGSQVGIGAAGGGPIGLLIGDSLRWFGGVGSLLRAHFIRDRWLMRSVTKRALSKVALRFRRYPLLAAPSALLNTLGQQLPPLLIAAVHGPVAAGSFFIVQKVMAVPITAIGRSIGDAYVGEFSRVVRVAPHRGPRVYLRVAGTLAAIALLPAITMGIGGRRLVPFFLGAGWEEAGVYLQIASVMFFAKFVANPLSQTLLLLQRQDWQLVWDAGRLLLVCAAMLTVSRYGVPSITVAAYAMTMCLSYVLLAAMSVYALRRHAHVTESRLG